MSHEQIIAIVIASGLVAGVGVAAAVIGLHDQVGGKAGQQLRRVRLLRL